MWPVGTEFREASIRSRSEPLFEVYVYDDTIGFYNNSTGSNLSGTNHEYHYNANNEKGYVSASGGTAELVGLVSVGSYVIGDGIGTIGTWISPVFTNYYPSTFTKLKYKDYSVIDSRELDVLFQEGFESFDGMIRNGATLNYNNGTMVQFPDYPSGKMLKIVNNGDSTTEVTYSDTMINANIFDSGEAMCSFRIDNFMWDGVTGGGMSTLEALKLYEFVSTGTHSLSALMDFIGFVDIAGTTLGYPVNLVFSVSGAYYGKLNLGTIGTGGYNSVVTTWDSQISGKLRIEAWLNGSYRVGTFDKPSPANPVGSFSTLNIAKMIGGDSRYGTYYIDNVHIIGTKVHGTGWTQPFLFQFAKMDYWIRTSDDGTTFKDWEWITGTRSFNEDTRALNILNTYYLGTSIQKGNFAQLRAVMSSPCTTCKAWMSGLYLTGQFVLDKESIMDISPISNITDTNFKIGLIQTNTASLKFSNIENRQGTRLPLFGEKVSDNWLANPLFYNRPPYYSLPLKIRAGWGWENGTTLVPLLTTFGQSVSVDADNLTIDYSGFDSWAKYGDLQAGSRLAGTYDISAIVKHCADYVGIPYDKQFIDNVGRQYIGVPPINHKDKNYLAHNNGGFGDIWNERKQNLGSHWSQSTDGNFIAAIRFGSYYQPNFFNSIPDPAHRTNPFYIRYKLYDKNLNFIKEHNWYDVINTQTIRRTPEHIALDHKDGTCVVYQIGEIEHVESWLNLFGIIFPVTTKGPTNLIWQINTTNNSSPASSPFPPLNYANVGGMFFDANTGTGYIGYNETGTVKIFRFNSKKRFSRTLGDANVTVNGTYSLQAGAGTNFTMTAFFMKPQPMQAASGSTDKWYYCAYGREGTNHYFYRFGTEHNSYPFIDKIRVGTQHMGPKGSSLTSGGWESPQGIITTLGYPLNNNYFKIGNEKDPERKLFNTGLFGMTFQHDTIGTVFNIKRNEIIYPSGSYLITADKLKFHFNELLSTSAFMTADYNIRGYKVGVDSTSYAFKELLQGVSVPANFWAYFDADGNFHFASKSVPKKTIMVGGGFLPTYTNGLVESPINSSVSKDVSRVKNEVTVTGAAGTQTYIDLTSRDIFGTRILQDYNNPFLITNVDVGTCAIMLTEYLKYPRYHFDVTLPFHPEIEVGDTVTYYDKNNGVKVPMGLIKATDHNVISYTTNIKGEERPTNKTDSTLL